MNNNIKDLTNQAIFLSQKGSFKEAIACYFKALKIEQKNHLIWFNLGTTYKNFGKLKEAKTCFEKALDLKESDADVLKALALTYFELKDFDNAEKYCLEGLTIHRKDFELWNIIGVIYFNTENYHDASSAFEIASSLNPFDYNVLYNLRDTYEELGNSIGKAECEEKMKKLKH